MIRIRFFSPFCDGDGCIKEYSEICDVKSDPDYGVTYCFTNDDDFSHAIIINHAMPDLNISKKNVLGLALEPPEFMGPNYMGLTNDFVEYASKKIGRYYIGSHHYTSVQGYQVILPSPFTEYYSFLWHTFPATVPRPLSKTKRMSIIFSRKTFAPGHVYRHHLVSRILESNLQIDIWGRGCDTIHPKFRNDPRIRGEFKDKEPYIDYQYHIAIENFRHQSYVSEKFTNCLVCECVPIYYGAYKIEEYFPNSCFKLAGNVDVDMKLIEAIYSGKMDAIKKNIQYPSRMKLTEHIKELFIKKSIQ